MRKKIIRLPAPLEHDEQVPVAEFCDMFGLLYYAIPNGGKRHKKTARDLKAEGVKAGVPDICICHAMDGYFGLYVEMKRRNGVPSDVKPSQRKWQKLLIAQGYKSIVCNGAREAIKAITDYMSTAKTTIV